MAMTIEPNDYSFVAQMNNKMIENHKKKSSLLLLVGKKKSFKMRISYTLSSIAQPTEMVELTGNSRI